jgi:hypothetical protein
MAVPTDLGGALDVANLTGIFYNSIMWIGLLVIVIGVVAVWYMRKNKMSVFKQYPLQVMVLPVFGKGFGNPMADSAKPYQDSKGEWWFEFKSGRKPMPAIEFKHIIPSSTRSGILVVIADSRDTYRAVNFIEKEVQVEYKDPETGQTKYKTEKTLGLEPAMDEATKMAFVNAAYANRDRFQKQSWQQMYLPYFALALTVVGIIVLVWITMDKMTTVANGFASLAQSFQTYANQCIKVA